MTATTINWDQLIEQKLDELEKIQPSSEDYLDRETRRRCLKEILTLHDTDEERVKAIKDALLGELFQVSMFC